MTYLKLFQIQALFYMFYRQVFDVKENDLIKSYRLLCSHFTTHPPQLEKEKKSLNEESLLLEDLTSGHSDVTQTLASRTLVRLCKYFRSRTLNKVSSTTLLIVTSPPIPY